MLMPPSPAVVLHGFHLISAAGSPIDGVEDVLLAHLAVVAIDALLHELALIAAADIAVLQHVEDYDSSRSGRCEA
jgi:hypothetical protein